MLPDQSDPVTPLGILKVMTISRPRNNRKGDRSATAARQFEYRKMSSAMTRLFACSRGRLGSRTRRRREEYQLHTLDWTDEGLKYSSTIVTALPLLMHECPRAHHRTRL